LKAAKVNNEFPSCQKKRKRDALGFSYASALLAVICERQQLKKNRQIPAKLGKLSLLLPLPVSKR